MHAHATSPLDTPVCSISRCINMCHVSHFRVRGDDNPDGILNAAFHVVSFSRLVHPSLLCHLVSVQPPRFTLECKRSCSHALPEPFQEFYTAATSAHHTPHTYIHMNPAE